MDLMNRIHSQSFSQKQFPRYYYNITAKKLNDSRLENLRLNLHQLFGKNRGTDDAHDCITASDKELTMSFNNAMTYPKFQ